MSKCIEIITNTSKGLGYEPGRPKRFDVRRKLAHRLAPVRSAMSTLSAAAWSARRSAGLNLESHRLLEHLAQIIRIALEVDRLATLVWVGCGVVVDHDASTVKQSKNDLVISQPDAGELSLSGRSELVGARRRHDDLDLAGVEERIDCRQIPLKTGAVAPSGFTVLRRIADKGPVEIHKQR